MKAEIVAEKQTGGIAMAVEFFNCFHWQYSGIDELKRYLNNQGLTLSQVEEAFTIHKKEIAHELSQSDKGEIEIDPIEAAVLFLRKDKQEEGMNLLHKFFKAEFFYCTILECLKKEYYGELAGIAKENEFSMTSKDVEEIFRCIPTLFKFHTRFYNDLQRGANIGWMFIRHLNFFNLYLEYMRDCTQTVSKIRGYILDDSLHKVLSNIRKRSKRRRDDMVDLLLVPLDRIVDYKNLVDKLYAYADKTHAMNYGFLGKAAKNLSKIAKVIETEKYDISNKNEMNKAQLFFGKGIDVLVTNRVILRRGMMAYKTKLVSLKKKMYMFFLFNDALVWSMKKNEDPNIVKLWSCSVVKSSGKKFKLQTKGQFKALNLECASEEDRDEWYDAVEAAIISATEAETSAWSNFKTTDESPGTINKRSFSLYQNHNRTETMGSDQNGDGDEKKSNQEVKTQSSQQKLKSSKEDDGLAIETFKTAEMTSFSAPKAAAKMRNDDEMKGERVNGLKTVSPFSSQQVAQKSTKLKLSALNENSDEKKQRKPSCIRIEEDFDSFSESVKRAGTAGSSIFFLSLEDSKVSPDKSPELKDSSRIVVPIGNQISPLPEETIPGHRKTPSSPEETMQSQRRSSSVPQGEKHKHKKTPSFSLRLRDL